VIIHRPWAFFYPDFAISTPIFTILFLLLLCLYSNAAPGNLDLSFDPGSNLGGDVFASAIDSNGKLLVGGMFGTVRGGVRKNIARLNLDGTMDPTFDPGAGADNNVYAIGLQSNGKIIIGGDFMTVNGSPQPRLARLNIDGSLDQSFRPLIDSGVRSILVLSNDQIVVGGNFIQVNGAFRQSIAQLNADGTLDGAFDAGYVFGIVFSILRQPDSKLVIGGSITVNGTNNSHIARLNANGSQDDGFNVKSVSSLISSMVLQPDLKIIIGGNITSINGNTRSNIARLNPDGSLDTNFIGRASDIVNTLALQSDGKVLIGGYFSSINGTNRGRLARLNPDGTLDGSFNADTFYFGGVTDVSSILVNSNGDILVGGQFATIGGAPRNGIALLDSSGSVQSGFMPNGGINQSVNSIAVQSDGKMVIGGYFSAVGNTNRNNIARLNADGTLDTTFDPGSGANGNIWCIRLQTDGQILAGGNFTFVSGNIRNHIARFNSNGNLDLTFNANPSDTVSTIVQQPDGRILIGGTFTILALTNRHYVARLNTNGTLDTTFDTISGPDAFVKCIALQPDGKVLVGGLFTSLGGTNRNHIARLNANGQLDLTFDSGNGANNWVQALAVQPDAKVLIGGSFTSINGTNRSGIARLLASGGLDVDFDPGAGPNGSASCIALQPDGKIVIGGTFSAVSGVPRNRIARLNSDGSLDLSFDPGGGAAGSDVPAIVLQPDTKILAVGAFEMFGGRAMWSVARLFGDGPRLGIDRSGPCVILSWATNFAGFNLQFATQMIGANWMDSPDVPSIVDNRYTVTNQIMADRVYRLRGP
jgi:uncharacterized delta-60 repeat protein